MLDRAVRLVWNPESRRLRLPWRFLLFAVALTVAGVAFVLTGLGRMLVLTAAPGVASRALFLVVQGAVVAAVVALAAVVLDRRRLADLGLRLDRDWLREFAGGLALGAALMTGIFIVAYLAGWARVTAVGGDVLPSLLLVTLGFLAVGAYEELLYRGYLLGNLAEGLQVGPVGPREATALAAGVSSFAFGLLHLGNPNATLASAAGITAAGLFLAAGYVFTGELALPIGVHVTWNLFQGAVYGFPVSGVDVGATVLSTRLSGPALITGGPFGPEAGLLGLAASVAGTVVVAAYAGATPDPRVPTPTLRWRDAEE